MPRIVGTGLAALDLIVDDEETSPRRFLAGGGGTCGNVLAALSALGWHSTFIGAVRRSPIAHVVYDDLKSAGVQVHLSFSDEGSTVPVIVEHVSRSSGRGNVRHWFSSRCPLCWQELPRFCRPTDAALQANEYLADFSDVFFADRLSAAIVKSARAARERGALVMYEPSADADGQWMREMVSIAHVVKFSADYSDVLNLTPMREGLWIETRGAAGLRWKTHGEMAWRSFPAELAARVVDTCGAGDWFTAGLLASLFQSSATPTAATEGHVLEALRRGARLAAWSCGFLGARGPLYDADVVDAWVALDGASSTQKFLQERQRPARPHVPADLWGHCDSDTTG
jgi:fructokinase